MNRSSVAFLFLISLTAICSVLAEPLPNAAFAEQSASRLLNLRSALGLDSQHTFQFQDLRSDPLGQTHVRFRQYYRGVRVWGGEVITHVDARGLELPMTEALRPNIDLDVTPTLTPAEVRERVEADLKPTGPYAR